MNNSIGKLNGAIIGKDEEEIAVSVLGSSAGGGQLSATLGKQGFESIKVLVRVRPLTDSESVENNALAVSVTSSTDLEVQHTDAKRTFRCSFDSTLGTNSTQLELYNVVRCCTQAVLDGFNSTIFAYGQTGSGKTYSMYGPPTPTGSRVPTDFSVVGVIPRTISEIFDLAQNPSCIQLSVYCSCVQIYNENLYDMLRGNQLLNVRDTSMSVPLTIREDQKEIYVQGLSEFNVKSISDTLMLLRVADENRVIRDTSMNQFSSRSHSIFQLFVEQKRIAADGGEVNLKSKFNLVDLAGSEKWNIMSRMRDDHIAEMTNINLSLHTLGRCISSLAQKAKGRDSHIPYRESKLTRLLQDSLGGNSKTFLIATVSASRYNVEETISTLKFADRAKQVMTQATANETRPVDHALVMRLQKEIEQLKEMLRKFTTQPQHALAVESGEQSDNRNNIQQLAEYLGNSEEAKRELEQEKSRVLLLQSENEKLKNELWCLKANSGLAGNLMQSPDLLPSQLQHLPKILANGNSIQLSISTIKQQSAAPAIPPNSVVLSEAQANSAVLSLNQLQVTNNSLWVHVDKLQRTMRRFFNFDIEEDMMKADVEKIFAGFQKVKTDHQQNAPQFQQLMNMLSSDSIEKVDATKPVVSHQIQQTMQQQTHQQTPKKHAKNSQSDTDLRNVNSAEVASSNYQSSRDIRKAAALEISSSSSNNNSSSNPQPTNVAGRHAMLPLNKQRKNSGENGTALSTGIADTLTIQPNLANAKATRYENITSALSSAASPAGGGYFMEPTSDSHQQGKARRVQPRDVADQQPLAFTSAIMSPSAHANALSFRVKGQDVASSGSVAWISAEQQELDEEAALLKEMKAAKKRLKKQQQLQEWIKEKEARQLAIAQEEIEERKALKEAELQKEAKRKERAAKQKEKLKEYENKIKSEAEAIEELKRLGIDPASIYAMKDSD